MPNVHFYGARGDLLDLIDLALELGSEVWEEYSPDDEPARRFRDPQELVAGGLGFDRYGRGGDTTLVLWSPAMAARPRVERLRLRTRDRPWREIVRGWGVIRLSLGGVHERTLTESFLSHNSEARARKRAEAAYRELGPPDDWNWTEVERLAGRLAHHIRRRRAVAKTEPPVVHYVLPEAHELCERHGSHARGRGRPRSRVPVTRRASPALTVGRRPRENRGESDKEVVMVERRWGAGAPWAEQIATASGVLFVVFAAIAFALVGDAESNASTDEIISYFSDNSDRIKWGAAVFGLAGGFLLWFGGTIASALRRAEGDATGRLPAIAVAAVASSVALYLVGVASWTALARTADEEGVSRALYDIGQQVFGISSFTAAVFVWALSTGIMRTRLLRDWVGWLGTALTVLLIVNGCEEMLRDSSGLGVLGTITFVAFLVWVLIASVLLTRDVRARERVRPTNA